ncbi:MAG TPA: NAD(P)H-hydrate dehydratase [Opitutaceae bacterium]|nr:NAD(P)H-hydrate dehydratase [Opitutaceae bacterium]
MSRAIQFSSPVLSIDDARRLEAVLFGSDESREWAAMQAAGRAIAAAIRRDAEEIGGLGAGRFLVLVGKGHNGGDALIAARDLLLGQGSAMADVVFVFGERRLRPLAARAWRELMHAAPERVRAGRTLPDATAAYDLCLDGVFGFQFRPPLDSAVARLLEQANTRPVRMRAAVDLPSGGAFRADFTYATGSVKSPLLDGDNVGRLRYLDLGFFAGTPGPGEATDRVLTFEVLDDLRALRPAHCDKRSYGHVFFLGGSRGFPGAILMSVTAAIRSGAGLVTAFVPESLAPAFAAHLPEAIWVGWPETPAGGLALEGEHLLRERVERAGALVIGPGIGREPETLALVAAVANAATVPFVLDADALQPEIVPQGSAARVITPHAGEFKRVAGDSDLRSFAAQPNLTVVLKGPVTRVCDGGPVLHSPFGGPVLARGGSGDLLAGMIGAQLAQHPGDPLLAAARAVVWHGHAADLLARARGAVAVRTTDLLDHLGAALRQP